MLTDKQPQENPFFLDLNKIKAIWDHHRPPIIYRIQKIYRPLMIEKFQFFKHKWKIQNHFKKWTFFMKIVVSQKKIIHLQIQILNKILLKQINPDLKLLELKLILILIPIRNLILNLNLIQIQKAQWKKINLWQKILSKFNLHL